MAILFHGSLAVALTVLNPGGQDLVLPILTWVVATLVVLRYGARNLARQPRFQWPNEQAGGQDTKPSVTRVKAPTSSHTAAHHVAARPGKESTKAVGVGVPARITARSETLVEAMPKGVPSRSRAAIASHAWVNASTTASGANSSFVMTPSFRCRPRCSRPWPKRPLDPLGQLLSQLPAGGRLDNEAGQRVVGVAVRPGRARRKQRRLVGHQGDQLPQRPGTEPFGKGGGFSDLEVALLQEARLLGPETLLVTTVHSLQVVDEPLPETEHDFRVDLIVTPDEVIWCQSRPRPPGILWEHLDEAKIAEVPVLAAHRSRRVGHLPADAPQL